MSKLNAQEWMDLFENEWWPTWRQPPKRKAGTNKTPARKSWQRIKNPSVELFNLIMGALKWFKQSEQWNKDDGQFIPMASTWINQERWTAYEEERGPVNAEPVEIHPEEDQCLVSVGLKHDELHKKSGLTLREKYKRYRGIQ